MILVESKAMTIRTQAFISWLISREARRNQSHLGTAIAMSKMLRRDLNKAPAATRKK
jgi:hypothetical protein